MKRSFSTTNTASSMAALPSPTIKRPPSKTVTSAPPPASVPLQAAKRTRATDSKEEKATRVCEPLWRKLRVGKVMFNPLTWVRTLEFGKAIVPDCLMWCRRTAERPRRVPSKLRRHRRMVPTMNKRTILGLIIGVVLAGFTIAVIEIFNLDVYLF